MSVTMHTSLGAVKLEIYCDLVPQSAENFLSLVASNYYNDSIFHRLIPDFMIQGGDPSGTGKGGSSISGSLMRDEFHPKLTHDSRGVVSMANNGPDTIGSQFFITFSAQTHLDGKYTVIGRVIDGWDVLAAMEKVQVGKKNRPVDNIVLLRFTMHANPLAG